MVKRNKIVFLDRDGVLLLPRIINNKSYAVNELSKMKVYSDSYWALYKFFSNGFKVIVVTNQPDSQNNLDVSKQIFQIHFFLLKSLNIDLILCCPHKSSLNCMCRKPGTLMLEQGLQIFNADSSTSWMIGDQASDIVAGNKLGLKTIKINRGWELNESLSNTPDFRCVNLFEAADIINQYSSESLVRNKF